MELLPQTPLDIIVACKMFKQGLYPVFKYRTADDTLNRSDNVKRWQPIANLEQLAIAQNYLYNIFEGYEEMESEEVDLWMIKVTNKIEASLRES
jgi:hypothetical protein